MNSFFKIFARFYNRYFSADKLFAKRLRNLIGFTPSNIAIFKLAFYHKSASPEKLYTIQSNERLEYLGDAVLGTIVAEYLFKKYPNSDEGFLTKMRSKIVKRQSLNKIADKMGLDVFLNQYNNTRLSRSMLGNALEALVGAVYLECGYSKTRNYVIHRILRSYLNIHELEEYDDNYKSQLLEWCQKNGQTVAYKMLAKYKFEKRDRFKVAVMIDGKKLAVADDFNKKSAEQIASEKAMRSLGLLEDKNKTEKPKRSGGSNRPNEFRKNKKAPEGKRTNSRSNSRSERSSSSNKPQRKQQSKPNPRGNKKVEDAKAKKVLNDLENDLEKGWGDEGIEKPAKSSNRNTQNKTESSDNKGNRGRNNQRSSGNNKKQQAPRKKAPDNQEKQKKEKVEKTENKKPQNNNRRSNNRSSKPKPEVTTPAVQQKPVISKAVASKPVISKSVSNKKQVEKEETKSEAPTKSNRDQSNRSNSRRGRPKIEKINKSKPEKPKVEPADEIEEITVNTSDILPPSDEA